MILALGSTVQNIIGLVENKKHLPGSLADLRPPRDAPAGLPPCTVFPSTDGRFSSKIRHSGFPLPG